ncbi:RhuM family protein [Vibrio gazogenes]|uniref:Virulence protein RhuM family protein n=1 Tax=Vibrio gazogenes DSM 21264 = NBRC 103151 TaxID=1123492 RepID=A0A1M5GRY4_VIBGA|nr:RhuM family protein [Vibrio gazogenes]USP13765.1 virulence RhuM family protein [Vibrio gazogenes]SHG06499.1 Virulence protein RhuM family protein [Vibrio gazogenes DSM 21264] [Vibrio gazogenes DSM 21264 = NBRC 103151]SJN58963.1 hypothetical protein BQ6471_03262 [Vibrio gazogenes]
MLRELGGQVWLTQLEIAELYQTSKQNISKHVKSVLSDGELVEGAVVNSKFTTAADGKEYLTQLYALPMIITVGYRVRSTRGTQFRQWPPRTLGEYLTKGFAMDDERLKDPRWDYFDEMKWPISFYFTENDLRVIVNCYPHQTHISIQVMIMIDYHLHTRVSLILSTLYTVCIFLSRFGLITLMLTICIPTHVSDEISVSIRFI